MERLRDGQWTALPPMPYALFSAGAAVMDGRLYVIGGRTNTVLIFDPAMEQWQEGPPMAEARQCAAVAVLGDAHAQPVAQKVAILVAEHVGDLGALLDLD